MSKNYHVSGNRSDGYKVKAEGSAKSSSTHDTQGEAEQAAKQYAAAAGGGEVRIHRPDGSIRDSDTVPPAQDPYPPKDTRH
ncbi:MAG TPA: DUF2188 domain-containing protein [Patescibacteria group bacterium]|jgi:hypothetical protein